MVTTDSTATAMAMTPDRQDPPLERLQKFLARAGVASRRSSEDLIVSGRVMVNGSVVTGLGVKVDPTCDRVTVDGSPVQPPSTLVYLLLNKPVEVMTTMDDPQGRPTVARYVPAGSVRLFPVGRLDFTTSGLLLLTNDGELAHMLMHPRFHVPKTYHAEVDGHPDDADMKRLRQGIDLDDGRTAPAEARVLSIGPGSARIEITLREGRKRQVRRMLSAVGHPVRSLVRTGFGPLTLGTLAPGDTRPLTSDEVRALRTAAEGGL